ncbi:MAG: hypothetical protein WBA98_03560, partial [Gordonia sp. (in: high G+C Gram-positive bacteria)]|uniref:hypothetical protein n=1 Tax=Gordonia sp. (in: high G+C Gram-positive bacteria) TaxID=84139 RepID=UPI003C795CE7
ASAALIGSAATAPIAHAAPNNDGAAAKQALDSIHPQATDAASITDGIAAANAVLKQLKITPFTPTLGACTDFTIAPAVGGAIAGPNTPLVGDLTIAGFDLNAVKKGEVLYGFVPVGTFNDTGSKKGMQVAWFNVNTFKGGFGEPMGGITDVILGAVQKRVEEAGVPAEFAGQAVAPLKAALSGVPSNGVRGGLVDTGSGTVLSAIYGTIKKGNATCYFFPSLGIATAK